MSIFTYERSMTGPAGPENAEIRSPMLRRRWRRGWTSSNCWRRSVSLSTRAIAERLSRSRSEIFRMVFVLQQRGYLVREAGTDRLALSRRLFDLGIRTPGGRQLTSVVLPLMERFSEETGQAAHLVV